MKSLKKDKTSRTAASAKKTVRKSAPVSKTVPAKKAPVKKTATKAVAKKAPVKKAAARKTPAKKAATKKAATKKATQPINSTKPSGKAFQLRLYVAGRTAKSVAAFNNLKRICETHLAGKYTIEVIDLIEKPQLAAGDQIFALPTLVRRLPEPIKKIIGDLSNEDRVLVGLDVQPVS